MKVCKHQKEIKKLKDEIKYLRNLCSISNIPPILLEYKTEWNGKITKKDENGLKNK